MWEEAVEGIVGLLEGVGLLDLLNIDLIGEALAGAKFGDVVVAGANLGDVDDGALFADESLGEAVVLAVAFFGVDLVRSGWSTFCIGVDTWISSFGIGVSLLSDCCSSLGRIVVCSSSSDSCDFSWSRELMVCQLLKYVRQGRGRGREKMKGEGIIHRKRRRGREEKEEGG